MLKNLVNIFLFFSIIFFLFIVNKYYFSIQNIKNVEKNRINIEKNLEEKTVNVPILKNDTENVIEFNSGFQNQIEDSKPRNFWNLLKIK